MVKAEAQMWTGFVHIFSYTKLTRLLEEEVTTVQDYVL